MRWLRMMKMTKLWFLSLDSNLAIWPWLTSQVTKSTIWYYLMISTPRATPSGFSLESKTPARETQSNLIFKTTLKATPCLITEWKLHATVREKPKIKTLGGIEVAQIFLTAKTISEKTSHLLSSFTHSHLHTPSNMTTTLFFLAIHYLTLTVI